MADNPASIFFLHGNEIAVTIRLTPKASQNRIIGIDADSEGNPLLKVTVTAVPENGKANDALLRLLSKTWKLTKSSLHIVRGTTDRRKIIVIEGEAARVRAKLEGWVKQNG
ncbi:MAG: DUF167 family protein [Proteobacteria bacterium]|nr:DUF167 family protein [Pseudomonadota bacterium]